MTTLKKFEKFKITTLEGTNVIGGTLYKCYSQEQGSFGKAFYSKTFIENSGCYCVAPNGCSPSYG